MHRSQSWKSVTQIGVKEVGPKPHQKGLKTHGLQWRWEHHTLKL